MSDSPGGFVEFEMEIPQSHRDCLDIDQQLLLITLLEAIDRGSKANNEIGQALMAGHEETLHATRSVVTLFEAIKVGGMKMIVTEGMMHGKPMGDATADGLLSVITLAWYGGVEYGKHLSIEARTPKEGHGSEEDQA